MSAENIATDTKENVNAAKKAVLKRELDDVKRQIDVYEDEGMFDDENYLDLVYRKNNIVKKIRDLSVIDKETFEGAESQIRDFYRSNNESLELDYIPKSMSDIKLLFQSLLETANEQNEADMKKFIVRQAFVEFLEIKSALQKIDPNLTKQITNQFKMIFANANDKKQFQIETTKITDSFNNVVTKI